MHFQEKQNEGREKIPSEISSFEEEKVILPDNAQYWLDIYHQINKCKVWNKRFGRIFVKSIITGLRMGTKKSKNCFKSLSMHTLNGSN